MPSKQGAFHALSIDNRKDRAELIYTIEFSLHRPYDLQDPYKVVLPHHFLERKHTILFNIRQRCADSLSSQLTLSAKKDRKNCSTDWFGTYGEEGALGEYKDLVYTISHPIPKKHNIKSGDRMSPAAGG